VVYRAEIIIKLYELELNKMDCFSLEKEDTGFPQNFGRHSSNSTASYTAKPLIKRRSQ
jgi:hypothetical protein